MSTDYSIRLTPHATSPSTAVRSIEARLSRAARGKLAATFTLEGALDHVRVPAPARPRFVQQLWQHTCCEIFVRRSDLPAYHEFNFAPSGEWAAYAFVRYREGTPLADEALDPHISVRRAEGKLELDAVIHLDRLSPMHASERLSLGVSAVIEDAEGRLSYWAIAHPSGKPDFHHDDAFALELSGV
jgi:hypothetical protein